MDVWWGVFGIIAVFVSTGIISIASTTLFTSMGTVIFSMQQNEITKTNMFVYTGDEALKLRQKIGQYPNWLRNMYLICHVPLCSVIFGICIVNTTKAITIKASVANGYMAFACVLVLIYVVSIIYYALRYNAAHFNIAQARVRSSELLG